MEFFKEFRTWDWGAIGTWFTALIALFIALYGNWRVDKREEKSRRESIELRIAEQRRFLTRILFDHLREIRHAYDEAITLLTARGEGLGQYGERKKGEAEASVYDLLNDKVLTAKSRKDLDHALRSISESASQNWNPGNLAERLLKGGEEDHRRVRGDYPDEK